MSIFDSTRIKGVERLEAKRQCFALASSSNTTESDNDVYSMNISKTKNAKHSKATIALHWGSALALIVSVSVVLAREYIEEKTYRVGLLELHRQLGLLVLLGVFFRIGARYWYGLVKPVEPMPIITRMCATLCHLLLYVLLLSIPVIGWAMTNAHNINLELFGLISLPHLVEDDSDLADVLTDYHIWASWGLLAILVLHVVGALFHHYILKDQVLSAMLPGRQARRQSVSKKI